MINEDMVTSGPATPTEEIQNQTAGGSMMGMPAEAQQAVKAEPTAEMPTAKEVSTDNKIYGTANDPERKPLWKPPVGKKISQSQISVPKAAPQPLPEAEVGNKQIVNQPATNEQAQNQPIFDNTGFDQLSDDDKGDFASQQAVIDHTTKNGTDEDKKEVLNNYKSKTEELQKNADSRWQLWATIASVALFAFSGGVFPPINFIKLTGQDEAKSEWNKFLANQAEYESSEQSKVAGTQAAGEQAVEDKSALEEGIQAKSDIAAAESGVQTAKALDWQYLKDKLEIDQKNAKELMKLRDELDTASQLKILQAAHGYTMEEKEQAYGFLVDEMKDKLESLGMPADAKHLKEYSRALMGDDAFTKNAGIVSNMLGTAAGVALKAVK